MNQGLPSATPPAAHSDAAARAWRARVPAYLAPPWLRGGHAQTIVPALTGWAPHAYRREVWDSPDGDHIALDWSDGPPDAPLLVLFHGLEGDSRSRYALALAEAARALGWAFVLPHFRGCGGLVNRAPRFYHSGDSDEIDWIVRRLARDRDRPLYLAGVSLGGNALAKWLGERGSEAARLATAAAVVSAPLDLAAGGAALGRGFNMVYTRMFLKTLKAKSLAKLNQFPGLVDPAAVRAARDLYDFDNVVTAPLHGFRDTDDYWRRASARPWLAGIALPTLVLNARNDPFLPATALPGTAAAAQSVTLEFPAAGGHVGFHAAAAAGGRHWLPRRVMSWFLDGY